MNDGYDEAALGDRLAKLPRVRAAAFAAMCAELLAPVWKRYCELTQRSDPRLLDETLDELWAAIDGSGVDLRPRLAQLDEDAPDEDDEPWVFESGYAQNASSSTAYAVEVWLDGDVQRAVWAARQVWEAADLTAEDDEGAATFGPPEGIEDVVDAGVDFVDESLAAAADETVGTAVLRARARSAAALWWQPSS